MTGQALFLCTIIVGWVVVVGLVFLCFRDMKLTWHQAASQHAKKRRTSGAR